MYLRLSSMSSGVREKEIKQCSSSVLSPVRDPVNSAPAPNVVLVDASQLLYHAVWPVAGTAGDLDLSFGVRLSHYPPEAQKLVLFDRFYEDEPTVKDHERMRRAGQDRRSSIWRPTHHSNAEKQSWIIPRKKFSSPASCVGIPYRITCSSLTNLTVLSPMMRRTSR